MKKEPNTTNICDPILKEFDKSMVLLLQESGVENIDIELLYMIRSDIQYSIHKNLVSDNTRGCILEDFEFIYNVLDPNSHYATDVGYAYEYLYDFLLSLNVYARVCRISCIIEALQLKEEVAENDGFPDPYGDRSNKIPKLTIKEFNKIPNNNNNILIFYVNDFNKILLNLIAHYTKILNFIPFSNNKYLGTIVVELKDENIKKLKDNLNKESIKFFDNNNIKELLNTNIIYLK